MLKPNNQDRHWTILESEYLIRRPWLTARKDRVRLPNGAENEEYYVLEYPDWVNVIALTRDGRFLMERQYRHGLQLTCYEICAGVCEPGETPLQSAQRELYEETGYGGGTWTPWMDISANTSTMTNLTHCFLATDVEPVSTQHLEARGAHAADHQPNQTIADGRAAVEVLRSEPADLTAKNKRRKPEVSSTGFAPFLIYKQRASAASLATAHEYHYIIDKRGQ